MLNCVITGGSGLIASEICRTFLNSGYRVYSLDKQEETASDLTHNKNFNFIQTDLSQENSIQKACSFIKEVAVLINAVGIADPESGPLENLSLTTWNAYITTNLTSYFLMSRELIPLLRKSKGSIIHISSTRHLMSEKNTEAYAACKGGINSLTHAMAISLGPDIRVNSVSPGWIASENSQLKIQDHRQHPVGRVGKPKDVAEICLFLAKENTGFITGQDFVVDGGMTRKMLYV